MKIKNKPIILIIALFLIAMLFTGCQIAKLFSSEPPDSKASTAQGVQKQASAPQQHDAQQQAEQDSVQQASKTQDSTTQPAKTQESDVHNTPAQTQTAGNSAAKPRDTGASAVKQGEKSTPAKTEESSAGNIDVVGKLGNIEYNSAEMVFDVIKLDWSKAQERLNSVKEYVNEIKPAMVAASVPAALIDGMASTVDSLEKNVSANKISESKEDANRVTKYVSDIEDSYSMPFPTDLGRLSYLTREIHLNVNQNEWRTARENYNTAKELWGKLQSKIHPEFKADIDNFDAVFEKLGKAVVNKDARLSVINSNVLLGNIQIIKSDFKKQSNKS